MLFLTVSLLLLVVARSCAPSQGKTVTIGEATYVCVVVNYKSYMVAVPKADDYSRIAIAGCEFEVFMFVFSFGAPFFQDVQPVFFFVFFLYSPLFHVFHHFSVHSMSHCNGTSISLYQHSTHTAYNSTTTFGPGQPRSKCSVDNVYEYGADKSKGLCQYTTIHAESHGVKSLTKAYKIYEPAATVPLPSYVFPVMTLVIHVAKGLVNSLTWDDGCYFCDSLTNSADGTNKVCQPNVFSEPNATDVTSTNTAANLTFPYTLEQLTAAKVDGYGQSCITYGEASTETNVNGENCALANGAECDLKMYIVWTGTDINGQYFQSAGLRFSRFQQFAISSLYTSARSLSLSVYDGASETATGAADTVKSRL